MRKETTIPWKLALQIQKINNISHHPNMETGKDRSGSLLHITADLGLGFECNIPFLILVLPFYWKWSQKYQWKDYANRVVMSNYWSEPWTCMLYIKESLQVISVENVGSEMKCHLLNTLTICKLFLNQKSQLEMCWVGKRTWFDFQVKWVGMI